MPDPQLRRFLARSGFRQRGAVMIDLDGTALHETDGQVHIAPEVVQGLRDLRGHDRRIILNTLRFPANVVRSCGRAFHAIQGAAVPLVSLNGGLGGLIDVTSAGVLGFEEVFAQPLSASEIEAALDVALDDPDFLLFFHPRDWRLGETLWTPDPGRIAPLRLRFPHADRVMSSSSAALRDALLGQDLCMLLMPSGGLPTYRQKGRRDFITGGNADKLSGARCMAKALGIDLAASIGAGDTVMDNFLTGCGLAVRVGAPDLPFAGLHATLDVADSASLGASMTALAALLDAG